MIIIKLWGGTCNQMFQYAFGYALSKKTGDKLAFETEFYSSQPSYVGKRCVISTEDFALTKLNFCRRPKVVNLYENKIINKMLRFITGCNLRITKDLKIIIERHLHYYEKVPHATGCTNYYDGYWQSGHYFSEFRNEIIKEFKPTPDIVKSVDAWRSTIPSKNAVAVHIRRGDYQNKVNRLNTAFYKIQNDASYYLRAMKYLEEKLDNPVFCIFSDDINWCKSLFENQFQNIEYVENKGNKAAMLDLFSISRCNHGIMSPSSFSWWGNWLRQDSDNSIVICPKGVIGNERFADDHWFIM